MSNITIQIATPADAAIIAGLSRETFYNAYASFNTKANIEKFMNEVFSREKLISELYLPDNIFLIAYENDNAVGYVRLKDKAIPEAELHSTNVIEIARIYTLTNNIGKGIGSRLMEECISIGAGRQREYIWLGVWEKNLKAIKFYERFGFIKFGEHVFVLGDDIQTDWLMMKKL